MHLQIYRCIEEFARLLDIESPRLADRMEFAQGEYTTFMEVISLSNGRDQLIMCNTLEREGVCAEETVQRMLARWTPQQTGGVGFRFMRIDGYPGVCCNLHSGQSIQTWYRLHQMQRKILASSANA
jgi:hypothetical protein